MDKQLDRHRFVQQYVERQKAYLPTYTTEQRVLNERHGTPPSKLPRSDVFGFDTPVLRPRVPVNKASESQPTLQAGPSKSRTHEAKLGPPSPETQDPALGKKDKPKSKRKKASTPIDTDNERAARLADRRERKRKKRAIVNPPQKHDDDIVPTAASKKGRAKAKKPAALALLYGFSATNVTKGRLTLKPAPSLGVFSKGRASAKKNVALTDSASRNELFSESAFLNKPSERAADYSNVEGDSDDSSVSSVSGHPMPQVIRTTKHTKEDQGKCTETHTVKTPQASTRAVAESEVWDIEVQSKLPSSACDVSSEPGGKDSAPVVLDLRGAEWAASMNVTGEHNKARTPSLTGPRRSRGHSAVCCSPRAISDLHDEFRLPHGVDVPSIHPSHSASQVGHRAADTQPSDLCLVTSKYFTEPKPVPAQEFAAHSPQTPRPNDGVDVLDSQIPDQAVKDAALDNSRPGTTWCHSSSRATDSSYDDYYTRLNVPLEPLGRPDRGYFESSVVEIQGNGSIVAPEYHHPYQSATWDWWCPSTSLATDDVGYVPVEDFEGAYHPLAGEYEDGLGEPGPAVEPCFFEARPEYDSGEGHFSEQWFCMAETGRDFTVYDDEAVDGSIWYSEGNSQDGDSGEDVVGFLEGRALLLGAPEDCEESPRGVGLSGLAQAEIDVASRLRDHWRPLRL
ncbi:hypothetical protein J3R83DRAFT_976 [Lanmaoa asiatica]|nr:hypothetical protein J3R83DRAFT_976 [Lanmaoa asiatica]